jgi:hypothetical protein
MHIFFFSLKKNKKNRLFTSFIYSVLPFIVRACSNQTIFGGSSWGEVPPIIISLCNFAVTWFIFASNFAFLIVAVLDFRRRCFVVESLDIILTKNIVRTRSYLTKTLAIKGLSVSLPSFLFFLLLSPFSFLLSPFSSHPFFLSVLFLKEVVLESLGSSTPLMTSKLIWLTQRM